MHAVAHEADLADVTTDDERGAEIQERIDALGISDREFYKRTGIDRKTLNRAITGEGTRPSTYIAIDAALTRMEDMVGRRGEQRRNADDDYVEFTVEGNFGVRAVVRGPVRDMSELQAAVSKLVREMRGDEMA